MGEIVNLRQFRKQKARAEAEKTAEQNRASFGRTKAEKKLSQAEQDLAKSRLDSHQRDDNEQP